jgi:hypothetical protein
VSTAEAESTKLCWKAGRGVNEALWNLTACARGCITIGDKGTIGSGDRFEFNA